MTSHEIRLLRDHLGLSQAHLAGILGVSQATIAHWEAGRSSMPPIYTATMMRLREKSSQVPVENINSKVLGFFLAGGIIAFLAWLYSQEE